MTIGEARNAVNSMTSWLTMASEAIPNSTIKEVAQTFLSELNKATQIGLTNVENLYKSTENRLKSEASSASSKGDNSIGGFMAEFPIWDWEDFGGGRRPTVDQWAF